MINHKNLSGQLLGKKVIKRLGIGFGVLALGIGSYLIVKTPKAPFDKSNQNILPSYPPLQKINNMVHINAPSYEKYSGGPLQYYPILMSHGSPKEIEEIVPKLSEAIQCVRNIGKKPVVIVDHVLPPNLFMETTKQLKQNSAGDLVIDSHLYEQQVELVNQQSIQFEKQITEAQSINIYSQGLGMLKPILEKSTAEKVPFYGEQAPLSSQLLINLFFNKAIPTAMEYLSQGNPQFLDQAKFIQKTFISFIKQRDAQLLERAYRISKEEDAIPILIVGVAHNFNEIEGTELVKPLQALEYLSYSRDRYSVFFEVILTQVVSNIIYQNRLPVSPLDMAYAMHNLCGQINENHIDQLLKIFKANRYAPHSKEFMVAIIKWFKSTVDPEQKNPLWQKVPINF